MGEVELPAELQHKLVWMVAAALRHYIVQHPGSPRSTPRSRRRRALIANYDEGATLEARAIRLARRLDGAGRMDGALLARSLSEGMLPFFIAGVSALCALDYAAARKCSPIRAGAVRPCCCAPPASGATMPALSCSPQQPRPPGFGREGVQPPSNSICSTRSTRPPRATCCVSAGPSAYRASVARISTRARPSAEAA